MVDNQMDAVVLMSVFHVSKVAYINMLCKSHGTFVAPCDGPFHPPHE